jgi:hypothetical protein
MIGNVLIQDSAGIAWQLVKEGKKEKLIIFSPYGDCKR